MTRFRVLALFALAAGLVQVAGPSAAQNPAQPGLKPLRPQPLIQPGATQPLPGQPGVIVGGGELPVVPKSSAAFISLKVSDLLDNAELKAVVEQLRTAPEGLNHLAELFGVMPREIDRVTLFWPHVWGGRFPEAPVLVVTTREAYNEARVLKALGAEPVFNDNPRGPGGRDGSGFRPFPPVVTKSTKAEPVPFRGPAEPGSGSSLPSGGAPRSESKPPAEDDPCSTTAVAFIAAEEPLFYELQRGPFSLLFLIDERTLVFLADRPGADTAQLALLAQLLQKKQSGPLADALTTAGTHTLAAGVYLPPIFRQFDRRLPPELAPYAALLAARTGVVTANLAKNAKTTLTLTFEDAAAARRAGPVLEEGLKALAGRAALAAAETKESTIGREKAIAPIIEAIGAGLKNAAVKVAGTTVVATTEIEVGPAAGKAAAELIQSLASARKFALRTNNLKQIGLALHAYHDANGKLPTNIYNAKGEAILSWRVHLLPYLEQDNLYRQFRMDEPWDGPNNKKFIEQMPKVYEVPGREAPKGMTYFQGFVSPKRGAPRNPGGVLQFGEAWLVEGEKTGRSLATIPDGTSNTIAVVEARDPVNWTKPDDIPFGEKLPPMGEARAERFAALMFDGSVRLLPTRLDAATLRALITVNGGEVIPDLDRPRRGFPGGGSAPREEVPQTAPEVVPSSPPARVKDLGGVKPPSENRPRPPEKK